MPKNFQLFGRESCGFLFYCLAANIHLWFLLSKFLLLSSSVYFWLQIIDRGEQRKCTHCKMCIHTHNLTHTKDRQRGMDTHYTFHKKGRLKVTLHTNSQEKNSMMNVLDTLVDESYLKTCKGKRVLASITDFMDWYLSYRFINVLG